MTVFIYYYDNVVIWSCFFVKRAITPVIKLLVMFYNNCQKLQMSSKHKIISLSLYWFCFGNRRTSRQEWRLNSRCHLHKYKCKRNSKSFNHNELLLCILIFVTFVVLLLLITRFCTCVWTDCCQLFCISLNFYCYCNSIIYFLSQ